MSYKFRQIRARRREEGKEPGLIEAGFTLIELLIVIVVLGILAAVVIFALSGVTQSSAASACNADAKSVETAVEIYHTQNDAWPATGDTGAATGLVPTYIRTWPSNTDHYTISVAANGEVDVTYHGSATALNYDSTTNPCTSVP